MLLLQTLFAVGAMMFVGMLATYAYHADDPQPATSAPEAETPAPPPACTSISETGQVFDHLLCPAPTAGNTVDDTQMFVPFSRWGVPSIPPPVLVPQAPLCPFGYVQVGEVGCKPDHSKDSAGPGRAVTF